MTLPIGLQLQEAAVLDLESRALRNKSLRYFQSVGENLKALGEMGLPKLATDGTFKTQRQCIKAVLVDFREVVMQYRKALGKAFT